MMLRYETRRAIAGLAAVFVNLIAMAAHGENPPEVLPRDPANASFWVRLDTVGADPLFPAMSWYQPLAALEGAPGSFIPLAREGHRSFSPQTIDEVTSYADATKGEALLVARDGVLQIEHYTQGGSEAPSHAFSTHSMTRVLGAVAIGILIDRGRIPSVDVAASTFSPGIRFGAPGPWSQIQGTTGQDLRIFQPGVRVNWRDRAACDRRALCDLSQRLALAPLRRERRVRRTRQTRRHSSYAGVLAGQAGGLGTRRRPYS